MAGSPIEGVGIEVPPSDCARDIVAHLSTLILISLKSISLSAEGHTWRSWEVLAAMRSPACHLLLPTINARVVH